MLVSSLRFGTGCYSAVLQLLGKTTGRGVPWLNRLRLAEAKCGRYDRPPLAVDSWWPTLACSTLQEAGRSVSGYDPVSLDNHPPLPPSCFNARSPSIFPPAGLLLACSLKPQPEDLTCSLVPESPVLIGSSSSRQKGLRHGGEPTEGRMRLFFCP